MVTRLPNHWCAFSWAATEAYARLRASGAADGSMTIRFSEQVIRPGFSLAPKPTVWGMPRLSS